MTAMDRELPHTPKAELAVLGSCLCDEQAVPAAQSILPGPCAFYSERNSLIYRHLTEAYGANEPLDSVLFAKRLQAAGDSERCGGMEYLADALGTVPDASRVEHYAKIVRGDYLLRQVISASHGAVEQAFVAGASGVDVLQQAAQALRTIEESVPTEDAAPVLDVYQSILAELDDPRRDPGVIVPWKGFETYWESIQPNEVVVVGARPSGGKSSLMLSLAYELSVAGRVPSLYVSFEMSNRQMVARLMTFLTCVPTRNILWGRLTGLERDNLNEAEQQLRDSALQILPVRGMPFSRALAKMRAMQNRGGHRIVFVDYLQAIIPDKKGERRQLDLGEMMAQLCMFASQAKITVMIGSQMRRETEDREKPKMRDLAESKTIEEAADRIFLLHSNPADTPNMLFINIAKDRPTGQIGDVEMMRSEDSTLYFDPKGNVTDDYEAAVTETETAGALWSTV